MKERILHCPLCEEVLIKQDHDFWLCPNCDTEVWPDDSKLRILRQEEREKKMMEETRKQVKRAVGGNYTEVLPPVPVVNKSKSGNNKTGKSRKKDMKKNWRPYYLE